MNSFVFDAWKVEIRPQNDGEIMHFFFLRDIKKDEWVYAVGGRQSNKSRIEYDVDYIFYKAYPQHIDFEVAKGVRTKKTVHHWLDIMSHYGDDRNKRFVKIKISDVHVNGLIDEVLHANFRIHVSSDSLSMKFWNGCSACLVHPTKSDQWISFLTMHKIKVGYTVFFIYLGRCDYTTVIFDKKQRLSLYDNKNYLPKDIGKINYFDTDTSIETDDDEGDEEDVKEEDAMDSVSDDVLGFENGEDEIIHDDIDLDDLDSGDDCPSPTLEQMDAAAKELDSIDSPSSHGYSADSSDVE